MKKIIFFFIKIFDDQAHAEDFINGRIFANRLSHFKGLEEEVSENRSDKYEGVVSWLQSEKIQLELNGYRLISLSGPVSLQMNQLNNLNVFCLFAGYCYDVKGLTANDIEAFEKQLEVPNDCQNLGNYAVIIKSPVKFLERVKASAKINNFGLDHGLVDYYNPETFHGSFSKEESIFKKHDKYSHQKEYRFVFDTNIEGDKPLFLDVGDISDITIMCKTSDINIGLEVKLSDS